MGTGKKIQTYIVNGSSPSAPNMVVGSLQARNLRKSQLGGVIFGCKNSTMKECLFKQLLGLPAHHFSYVKNIDPGLPLFLFNYSDRKLHGIFEAACPGQMNINPYGWTTDGSDRTLYPAQVQIRIRLQCQPLLESQFRPIIADNYYNEHHFWFELDHAQTNKMLSLLASLAVAPGTSALQNMAKSRTIFRAIPSRYTREVSEEFSTLALEAEHLSQSSQKSDSTDVASSLDGENQSLESQSDVKEVKQEEKDLIYMKLKALALKDHISNEHKADAEDTVISNGMPIRENDCPKEPVIGVVTNPSVINDISLKEKGYQGELLGVEDNCEQTPSASSEYQSLITRLIREVEELKTFKTEHTRLFEQKLGRAEREIQVLKRRLMLESESKSSTVLGDEKVIESFDDLLLDTKESIFLLGGYDSELWLSDLDSFYPSQNVLKSLRPMNSVRSYASVAQLNGEVYVMGGGNGQVWYDTVESYNPAKDQWTLCPSLSQKKGSLAGACANNRIFAMGGGNGIECFSNVEMLDLDVGRWINTRSMLQKRFALAAVELNGVIYATGGFDGNDYLKSAERFDPREHCWTNISAMNTRRGCHSLVVLNEKVCSWRLRWKYNGYECRNFRSTNWIMDAWGIFELL
ncbi:uncharacterized protein LOC21404138 isoform X2 [Morus notabilis]|uniref:uncharacterized protein LOC21404138 isoform X2 n=1 Tax=Morus notabilis TaxID=981085 RepID=UPI000CED5E7A|nr:uncharacterized protein LOC21404138 isoform X2 [Morus notabilis]